MLSTGLLFRPLRFRPFLAFKKCLPTLIAIASSASLAATICPPANAYNPPVATEGPLTVRIEAPEIITTFEQAFSVHVHLQNKDDQTIRGTLQMTGIDQWQCEPIDSPEFAVPAGGTKSIAFEVTPSKHSYSAHYPLHAVAKFDWQGKLHTAHPIHILRTEISASNPAASTVAWRPFVLSHSRNLSLWQLPVFRAVHQVFGREAITMPTGWTGSVEPNRASITLQPSARIEGIARDAIAIHPPWARGQIGSAWIEYPLTLPKSKLIELRFHTGLTESGRGDGVTFRVRAVEFDAPEGAMGRILWQQHRSESEWTSTVVDLGSLGGRSVRLQLESDPGPNQNTAFDLSYWGEPTLVVGPDGDASSNVAEPTTGVNVLYPLDHGITAQIETGQRGLLDASLRFRDQQERQLTIHGFQVRVQGMDLHDAGSPIDLYQVVSEPSDRGMHVRHRFRGINGSFDLVGEASTESGLFRVEFSLENAPQPTPWQVTRIESLQTGPFSESVRRLYAGHGNVIEAPQAFRLNFDGHRLATSFVGFDFAGGFSLIEAVDLPPLALNVDPAKNHYSLETAGEATLTFIPGISNAANGNVWRLVQKYRQHNGLVAAAGVKELAGRFVFDLWGGHYRDSQEKLSQAFRYGLTDTVVVWHNWQRWGYDYRLPEIYPPNPKLGTEAELRAMIDCCLEAGVLFALHDNYIDYYPDAEGFSYDDKIAFRSPGEPVKAWLNEGRNARSYRYRADKVATPLQRNVRQIFANLAPTSYFIDVWSSAGPYAYWTSDGAFHEAQSTRDTWGAHFAWIRQTLGNNAPQISESGHDQLIGWLDGAQANHMRVGEPLPGRHGGTLWNIECEDAQRIPWFDAAHHDRFILSGAGYSDRYAAGLDASLHGIDSDDYISTEIMTGHPAMVSQPFGRDVVRKYWLTQPAMRALAMRTIEDVEFVDDDIHRQHIKWSGGAKVWINRGADDWVIDRVRLPEYGFLASIPSDNGTITASIQRRDGVIVEQCSAPEHLYVNARSAIGDAVRVHPKVVAFSSDSPRTATMTIHWNAQQPIAEGYRPFLHFVDSEGEIIFQATYDQSAWDGSAKGSLPMQASLRLPDSASQGDTFELRVGLYHPGQGDRLRLLSGDDGKQRVRLGNILVESDDEITKQQNDSQSSVQPQAPVSAEPLSLRWTPASQQEPALLKRQNRNAVPIDFGWVITSGACRLSRTKEALILMPLPNENSFGVRWQLRPEQFPWETETLNQVTAVTETGKVLWKRSLNLNLTIEHDPGAFAYRIEEE